MDTILGEITLTRRRKKLDEMTKGDGLSGAYTEILSRMKDQPGNRSKLGMKVLMWVSHAERLLQVDELCHALGAEGSIDLGIGDIPAIETLLACSLGLVTVEKSSSTVRLIHYTLQEYLSNNSNLFPNPHSTIAEVCLTYLNFPQVRRFSPALHSAPSTAPFVEYASCYWGEHARSETTESVKILALKLLDGYDRHISSKVLLLHSVRTVEQPLDEDGIPRGFTGLHGAAYFGCMEIIVALLRTNKGDVWATDIRGNVPIAWASRRGHERVVRVLMEWSNINSGRPGTKYGSAPLLWAAENGHEGVVRILLGRNDVNPNKSDGHCRTPLLWASKNGHDEVVRMLLKRNDINPNKQGFFSQTPLWSASEKGHEAVVKMLLERNDINPNKCSFGLTPLYMASNEGHDGVVRMLLKRNDVNPNKQSLFGLTPLWSASREGREEVVRILLERNDINPNQSLIGITPLMLASDKGNEGVVKRLLGRNDISPSKSSFGQTPLWSASQKGHEGVVKRLLERNDTNVNQGLFGQTPLMSASKKGHEGVVKMLLEQNGINPNQGNFGRTPLVLASSKGHEGVVSMLLERNDTNPHKPERQRRKLLWWTSRHLADDQQPQSQ